MILEAVQISKNYIKGLPINSFESLMDLATNKQSVYHQNWGLKPASVIINMNFAIIYRAIKSNQLHTTIKFKPLKIK